MPARRSSSVSGCRGIGRKKRRRVFSRRRSSFPRARLPHFPHLPSSLFHFAPLVLRYIYIHIHCILLPFAPSLANLHVPSFSRAPSCITHPFQRSSLSHLHPLVAFVGRVDSLNSVTHFAARRKPPRVFAQVLFQFCYTHLTSRPNLRALAIETELSPSSQFPLFPSLPLRPRPHER